jgi:hypothetical protein
MTTPAGTAAAARQAATGFALRAQPSASCRALKDLHHFLGHEPQQQLVHVEPRQRVEHVVVAGEAGAGGSVCPPERIFKGHNINGLSY